MRYGTMRKTGNGIERAKTNAVSTTHSMLLR